MTTLPPFIHDLAPHDAQVLLRVQERALEIVATHIPQPGEPPAQLSPLTTIKVEAMAHLVALAQIHAHGAQHHTANGNPSQADLWDRDTRHITDLASALFLIHVR